MAITSKEIWEAIKNDANFMERGFQYEGPANILKEYIEKDLLTVVGDMIDKPVTLANIIDVKVAYIKHAIENGFLSRVIKAMPEEALGFFGADELLEMTESLLGQMVAMLEPIAKDVPTFLAENGISEKLVYEQIKLSPENVAKALKGEITIGDILVSQPAVILSMNDSD